MEKKRKGNQARQETVSDNSAEPRPGAQAAALITHPYFYTRRLDDKCIQFKRCLSLKRQCCLWNLNTGTAKEQRDHWELNQWQGEKEMANGTRAGLPEQRWIIAQMQTCWKNLFNDLISLTIKCKMFPWHLSTHVKIPCKVANSPLETTCYLSRPGQEGSLHVNGVHSAVTYSCRRLFILAKASAWMERMALSPRFLHNTTKGSVNKRGAMPIAKALQI